MQVEAVDCIGCGDSMAAAIVLGFIRQASPAATLTLANAGKLACAYLQGRNAVCDITISQHSPSMLCNAPKRDGLHQSCSSK